MRNHPCFNNDRKLVGGITCDAAPRCRLIKRTDVRSELLWMDLAGTGGSGCSLVAFVSRVTREPVWPSGIGW